MDLEGPAPGQLKADPTSRGSGVDDCLSALPRSKRKGLRSRISDMREPTSRTDYRSSRGPESSTRRVSPPAAATTPEAHCLPMGNMQFHTQGAPRKFVQTPTLLVILYEASMGVRQIYYGRPALAGQRSATLVLRLFDRPLGRRRARRDERPTSATASGSTSTAAR